MKFLPAPWRWGFISKIGQKKGCIFCSALKKPGKEGLVCSRGKNYFVILNKYPYSTGHLMIVPYKHSSNPAEIPPLETVEMWELMNRALTLLKDNFNPAGFNIGMNLGRAAGAGVKDHFHLHIVPRWEGDANYMAVIGKTKVVSYSIEKVFDTLQREFNK
ncbi:MAG: HIT domain-containing protein [Candidatus Aminicenantes bacterium]|nr:HIT domain-containing protein [Candidatus Aminicenantes bacterium]